MGKTEQYDDGSRVYFVQSLGTGRVKIGYSRAVLARRSNLQVGSDERIRILLTLPGGKTLEDYFHALFHTERYRGEWFDADDRVSDAIRALGGLDPSDLTGAQADDIADELGPRGLEEECPV